MECMSITAELDLVSKKALITYKCKCLPVSITLQAQRMVAVGQNNHAVELHTNSTLLLSFYVDFGQFPPSKFIPSAVPGIADLFLLPIFQFCDAFLKLKKRREDYHCG